MNCDNVVNRIIQEIVSERFNIAFESENPNI